MWLQSELAGVEKNRSVQNNEKKCIDENIIKWARKEVEGAGEGARGSEAFISQI